MPATDFASLETTLREYLEKLADSRGKARPNLGRAERLIDRGIFDSMSLLDFVVFTEKLCGIKIPGEDVHPENFGSLEAIMLYLQERL
jgi:acyl carrier protein